MNQVTDNAVKETGMQCLTMIAGIVRVLLQPGETNDKAGGLALQEVNITHRRCQAARRRWRHVAHVVRDAGREGGKGAGASNRLELSKDYVHDQVQGFSNVIRGELGTKSSSLEMFGIKMLGGRGGRRKSAAVEKKKDDKGAGGGSSDGSKS